MSIENFASLYSVKIRSNSLERSQLGKLGTQCKNQVIWSWKESIWYRMQKWSQMVLKGVNWVNWVQNVKIRSYGLERSQLGTHWQIRSNGLERSQFGTQCKNQVIWSWKESIGYTLIKWRNQVIWSWKETIRYTIQKSGHIVLKGVNLVQNAKIRSNGLERSQLSKLGTQC